MASPRLPASSRRGHHHHRHQRERFAWARLYAGRRAEEVPPRTRWLLAVGAPLLGPLLFAPFAQRFGLAWTPLLALPGLAVVALFLRHVPQIPIHTA